MYCVLNTCQGIYPGVACAGKNCDMCSLLPVLPAVCLLLIVLRVEQRARFFTRVLVPCVSTWCEETVTVIRPEVTTCG